jgi:hypothetical protein
MRWFAVLVVLALAGCTSTWERHQKKFADAEARGDDLKALSEQQWMIENAFIYGPHEEHSPEADARRYLRLAKLAAKAGKYQLAIQSLKLALDTDPTQAPAVRRQLNALPLSPKERNRLGQEFAWNIAALQPGDDALQPDADENVCWSYRVREVRVQQRTVSTPDGMQHRIEYDARSWFYDSAAHRWSVDGEWMTDAGSETQWVHGPSQPRYQALVAPGTRFYTDGRVPACHRGAWHGPYDLQSGTIFGAAQLPATP